MPVLYTSLRLIIRSSTSIGIIILLILFCVNTYSQRLPVNKVPIDNDITKQTFTYAVKDTSTLRLDVYTKDSFNNTGKRPCVIFVFGGAFISGQRDNSIYYNYFNFLAEHNYIVASISYRLGLRGAKKVSVFHTAPLKNAIDIAVEDLYDATGWLITHADSIGIDTSKIILSGSSAGAITILQAEFLKENNKPAAKKLPPGFQYAGIISFSGAILSYDGKLNYADKPSPTLLFHGTADKIVPYKKIRLFNKGFYGSSAIAGTFKKNHYSYYIVREEDLGHEVAILPMYSQLPVILYFLDNYVMQKKPYQTDMSFKNFNQQPMPGPTAKEFLSRLQSR